MPQNREEDGFPNHSHARRVIQGIARGTDKDRRHEKKERSKAQGVTAKSCGSFCFLKISLSSLSRVFFCYLQCCNRKKKSWAGAGLNAPAYKLRSPTAGNPLATLPDQTTPHTPYESHIKSARFHSRDFFTPRPAARGGGPASFPPTSASPPQKLQYL